jgi:hypothetical protein
MILVLVIAAFFMYQIFMGPKFKKTVIDGYLGGEKSGLFDDERFTGAMSKYGSAYKRAEVVFNSPVVLYTRKPVAEAFKKQGWIHTEDETEYIDLLKLIDTVLADTKWSAIGINELYGNIYVISTDPLKSNSGNMFAGLVANMLNNGAVADGESLQRTGGELKRFFSKLGYLESSSADIFNSFLKTGIGAKPVIVEYESQILEFSVEHPEDWAYVKDDIVVLYPEPTVWSAHPFIALTVNGDRVIDALLEAEMQSLAWETHGFRTGIASGQESKTVFDIKGVPGQVKKVIQLPNPDTMQIIMDIIAD